MAEFQEVMRQRERICTSNVANCSSCPIGMYELCMIPNIDKVEEYEAAIMKWAADNPEPQYPTWIDWQQKMFPTATNMICPKQFMSKEEANCIGECCYECVRSPIPADIAKRLGIAPLKGESE